MVSLLISKLGKLIYGCRTPEAAYEALEARGYLSAAGLAVPATVIFTLRQIQQNWPARPAAGAELWRSMQTALEEGGFLSASGLAAAREFVSR